MHGKLRIAERRRRIWGVMAQTSRGGRSEQLFARERLSEPLTVSERQLRALLGLSARSSGCEWRRPPDRGCSAPRASTSIETIS
jgi:hypothetical protein